LLRAAFGVTKAAQAPQAFRESQARPAALRLRATVTGKSVAGPDFQAVSAD
jgi:hypothetical protein